LPSQLPRRPACAHAAIRGLSEPLADRLPRRRSSRLPQSAGWAGRSPRGGTLSAGRGNRRPAPDSCSPSTQRPPTASPRTTPRTPVRPAGASGDAADRRLPGRPNRHSDRSNPPRRNVCRHGRASAALPLLRRAATRRRGPGRALLLPLASATRLRGRPRHRRRCPAQTDPQAARSRSTSASSKASAPTRIARQRWSTYSPSTSRRYAAPAPSGENREPDQQDQHEQATQRTDKQNEQRNQEQDQQRNQRTAN